MKIANLEDFLFTVQPSHDHSIKAAMSATGLSEYMCKKYFEEAIKVGLYRKEIVRGTTKGVAKAHRFVKKYRYTKIK